MTADETLADLLGRYRAQNDAALRLVDTADLDAAVPVPRMRRGSRGTSTRGRCAGCSPRHQRAGPARRPRRHHPASIDGATMYELIAAAEGMEPTPWLQPWRGDTTDA